MGDRRMKGMRVTRPGGAEDGGCIGEGFNGADVVIDATDMPAPLLDEDLRRRFRCE